MSTIGTPANTGAVRSLTGITTLRSGDLTINQGNILSAGTVSATSVNAAFGTFDNLVFAALSIQSAYVTTLTTSETRASLLTASVVSAVEVSATTGTFDTITVANYHPTEFAPTAIVTQTIAQNFSNATLMNVETIHSQTLRSTLIATDQMYGATVAPVFTPASSGDATFDVGSLVVQQTDPPLLLFRGLSRWYKLSASLWTNF